MSWYKGMLFATALMVAGCSTADSLEKGKVRCIQNPGDCPNMYIVKVDGVQYIATLNGGLLKHEPKVEQEK